MASKQLTRWLEKPAIQTVLAWLVAQWIGFVWLTGRWRIENDGVMQAHWQGGPPLIGVFWHGHIMMMPRLWRSSAPFHMLISDHRDGRLISRIMDFCGIKTLVGTTSRQASASAALKAMVRLLRSGQTVGITPDGPRGPRMHMAMGPLMAAKLSGAVIVPMVSASRRRKVLSSWDQFTVALPFSDGLMLVGEALSVPADSKAEDLENLRLILRDRLIALTHEAERRMGHPPTQPGTSVKIKR